MNHPHHIECPKCNSSRPMRVENDLYRCTACGYTPPTPDTMASRLRSTLQTAILTSRPEDLERLREDQWMAFQYCQPFLEGMAAPHVMAQAPSWAFSLFNVVEQCQDDMPELYDDEA